MNEVRHTFMHSVVVALMAERQAIAYDMAQFWKISNFFDVMCFKTPIASAMLASIAVFFQYFGFPSQVFRASPSLALWIVFPLGYALTFHPTIHMSRGSFAKPFYELLAAYLAGVFLTVYPALLRTINLASNHAPRSLKRFATPDTQNRDLLRLKLSRTFMRTKTLLSVHVPISVSLFRNNLSAYLTRFQSLRMWNRLWFFETNIRTCFRTKFTIKISFDSLARIKRNRFSANLAGSIFHECLQYTINAFDYIIAK